MATWEKSVSLADSMDHCAFSGKLVDRRDIRGHLWAASTARGHARSGSLVIYVTLRVKT